MVEIDSRAANVHAAELGAIQHGLITNAQARALGMGKAAVQRRVQAGHWRRLRRGVYAFAGSTKTRERDLLEAVLAAGPCAVVCGFTAAEVWKLPDIRPRPGLSVAVPPGVQRTSTLAQLEPSPFIADPDDVATRDGLPVTSVARTYVAIATALPEHVLARSITQAIERGLLQPAQLRAAVERGGAPAALEKLEAILAEQPWRHLYRSKDERRAHQLLQQAGLEDVTTNEPVEYAGLYVGEVDLLHCGYRLGVEVDGPLDHSAPEAKNHDKVRTLAYRALGLRVVRVATERLRDADDFHALVARELQRPLSPPVTEAEFRRLWAGWIARYGDPSVTAPRRASEAAARWAAGVPRPLPWLTSTGRGSAAPAAARRTGSPRR